MKNTDIVILTGQRYVALEKPNAYEQNILLEDQLVCDALEKLGLKVCRKAWSDADFDWSSANYLLFRSTWDYFDHFPEFSKWLDATSKITKFINPEKIIRWNLDKHYLIDLEAKGVHCTPTIFIEKGDKRGLSEIHDQSGWETTVLKPCVSGTARHTYKLTIDTLDKHESIFTDLIKNESMMLQQFQENIVSEGEISMILLGGVFSHAVLKKAKAGDFRVQDDFGGSVQIYKASTEEIIFAEKVVNACEEMPAYARVDIFKDNNGELAISELELIEPELWFRFNPKASHSLATFIKKHYF